MRNVRENEDGFALVLAMMIMVVMTLLGVAATNNTIIELGISGNERWEARRFYTADSGWKQSGPFLNRRATPPMIVNLTKKSASDSYGSGDDYYQIVRNFGSGGNGTLNDDFPDDTEDGRISNIPYWYQIIYQDDYKALKFGANYRDFQYGIDCTAEATTEIATRVKKVFRIGY